MNGNRTIKVTDQNFYIVQKIKEEFNIDYDIKDTPTKSPKRNPDWVGGGAVANKIKEAKETSRKIEVQ